MSCAQHCEPLTHLLFESNTFQLFIALFVLCPLSLLPGAWLFCVKAPTGPRAFSPGRPLVLTPLLWCLNGLVAVVLLTIAVHGFLWPALEPDLQWWSLTIATPGTRWHQLAGEIWLGPRTLCEGGYRASSQLFESTAACEPHTVLHPRFKGACLQPAGAVGPDLEGPLTSEHTAAEDVLIVCENEHNRRLWDSQYGGLIPTHLWVSDARVVPVVIRKCPSPLPCTLAEPHQQDATAAHINSSLSTAFADWQTGDVMVSDSRYIGSHHGNKGHPTHEAEKFLPFALLSYHQRNSAAARHHQHHQHHHQHHRGQYDRLQPQQQQLLPNAPHAMVWLAEPQYLTPASWGLLRALNVSMALGLPHAPAANDMHTGSAGSGHAQCHRMPHTHTVFAHVSPGLRKSGPGVQQAGAERLAAAAAAIRTNCPSCGQGHAAAATIGATAAEAAAEAAGVQAWTQRTQCFTSLTIIRSTSAQVLLLPGSEQTHVLRSAVFSMCDADAAAARVNAASATGAGAGAAAITARSLTEVHHDGHANASVHDGLKSTHDVRTIIIRQGNGGSSLMRRLAQRKDGSTGLRSSSPASSSGPEPTSARGEGTAKDAHLTAAAAGAAAAAAAAAGSSGHAGEGKGEGGYVPLLGRRRAVWPPRVVVVLERHDVRRLLNVEEVVAHVVQRYGPGVKVHQREARASALCEQALAVADADLVIAVHGGHVYQALFALEGAAIVEVLPFNFWAAHTTLTNAGAGFRVLFSPGLLPHPTQRSGLLSLTHTDGRRFTTPADLWGKLRAHVFAHVAYRECRAMRACQNTARSMPVRANVFDLHRFFTRLDAEAEAEAQAAAVAMAAGGRSGQDRLSKTVRN